MTPDQPHRVQHVLERALGVGFTRSDLLLMGELADVSGMAEQLGVRFPTAVSGRVDTAARALAWETGTTYRRVLMRLLTVALETLEVVRTLRDDAELTFRLPGVPFAMTLHVGFAADDSIVLTVYADSEHAARVVPALG